MRFTVTTNWATGREFQLLWQSCEWHSDWRSAHDTSIFRRSEWFMLSVQESGSQLNKKTDHYSGEINVQEPEAVGDRIRHRSWRLSFYSVWFICWFNCYFITMETTAPTLFEDKLFMTQSGIGCVTRKVLEGWIWERTRPYYVRQRLAAARTWPTRSPPTTYRWENLIYTGSPNSFCFSHFKL